MKSLAVKNCVRGAAVSFFFVRDGHGSTRSVFNQLAQALERYDYDAFGQAVAFYHFDAGEQQWATIGATAAMTVHLFGGDAEYDRASGFYYHDARWRDGFRFVSYDSFEADPSSPASLHKYLYASANPISFLDPNGQLTYPELAIAIGIAALVESIILVATVDALIRADARIQAPRYALGQGGPDISAHLRGVDAYLTQTCGRNAPALPFFRMWDGWDFSKLVLWGKENYGEVNPTKPGVLFDGSDRFMTVTVDGRVYRPEEVNYYLYGVWMRLTGKSLEFGERKIIVHRMKHYGGTATGGRIAWMKAGYYGDFSYARDVAIGGALPGRQYNGILYFSINNSKPRAEVIQGNVFPDGSVVPGDELFPDE